MKGNEREWKTLFRTRIESAVHTTTRQRYNVVVKHGSGGLARTGQPTNTCAMNLYTVTVFNQPGIVTE